ncbi:hypothetical protein CGCF415_v006543 [Colletotrichum fructicola]|uniref:Glycosyl transferase family 8 protein n=2 Tax=Colletotrichum gloeosporioides species complex TaxID=2707338 RepID=A0A7J6J067_COLFN|nr:uncharacterized protein CGMCC3_g9802 [Colletotrichum fructicola]KAF4482399.1 hypothetical protein CGGC5_v009116 [Colletotrichum fructicola Nara gc5]KAI8290117.1 hypothetical protein K4K60_006864 [Colletotrichum sp. SAR11_57]KAE9574193.1 hypothetical protein CGMCC3_g9802 [Colletotrichum fructicola]KAF4430848.1 hypothetical protein CFRS1_v009647 [Colletotrichum fructicola]KAF4883678.1 hypothetical protein CGCFRS4_v013369 [Colletotrichum fructicola]
MIALNSRLRNILPAVFLFALVLVLVRFRESITTTDSLFRSSSGDGSKSSKPAETPRYKPAPTYTPPPVIDPFPLLANTASPPPPVPAHNRPRKDVHKEYGLEAMPPLFIGFTRQWPILLQCVASYIAAGWPPSSIHVLENTGVQIANARGKLSLQNPFYLNHTTLSRLGVNVVQAPALLSFSQMQNMFLHTAHANNWPYYFYSHQDVVVFSAEDGRDDTHRPGDRPWEFYSDAEREEVMNPPAAGEKGYRTIYENCLRDLNTTLERKEKWAFRWYQYDHLTLVNRAAMDAIGGWDSLIPYYATDCDMNARLTMDGWTMKHRRVGIVNDVSTHLRDLGVLFRVPGAKAEWVDPNPPNPADVKKEQEAKAKKAAEEKKKAEEEKKKKEEGEKKKKVEEQMKAASRDNAASKPQADDLEAEAGAREYFRSVVAVVLEMTNYKYRGGNDHNRNSWQKSQRGGEGEPYYYNAEGFAEAFEVLVGAGRKIFEMKWGRGGCDIAEGFGLKVADQWRVLPKEGK